MADYPALDLRHAAGSETAALHDLLHAALDDFAPLAIQDHETADGWRVFFRSAALRDAAAAALAESLGAQLASIGCVDVPDERWAQRCQAGLRAVRAGRIVVAPPWDVPGAGGLAPETGGSSSGSAGQDAAAEDILIVIDPSMGFGTGHHETTRLCLELLQSIELTGKRVIDVGTGSGVLAIAAWMLGATSIVGLDNDPDALVNAAENIRRNAASGVSVREADLTSVSLPPAEVVIANLTGAVLKKHAERVTCLVIPDGHILVSGFAPEERAGICEALGCEIVCSVTEGSWAAIHVIRRPPTAHEIRR